MSLLVIAIIGDNDLGRKTGIRSPVIGREANIRASLELGLLTLKMTLTLCLQPLKHMIKF